MARRFILTGTPGSGKTAILRQLEVEGYGVVEEAATDVIALWQAHGIVEPWLHSDFIDAVVRLQRQRLERASRLPDAVQFHDRSPICTTALAAYLERPVTAILARELDRIRQENFFEEQVFFVRNLGFVTPTDARRISFEESLRFEHLHQRTYREHGFHLIFIEPASLAERVEAIQAALAEGPVAARVR